VVGFDPGSDCKPMEGMKKILAKDLTDAISNGLIVGSQEVNVLNSLISHKWVGLVIDRGVWKIVHLPFRTTYADCEPRASHRSFPVTAGNVRSAGRVPSSCPDRVDSGYRMGCFRKNAQMSTIDNS
jgi:hypothetical protein